MINGTHFMAAFFRLITPAIWKLSPCMSSCLPLHHITAASFCLSNLHRTTTQLYRVVRFSGESNKMVLWVLIGIWHQLSTTSKGCLVAGTCIFKFQKRTHSHLMRGFAMFLTILNLCCCKLCWFQSFHSLCETIIFQTEFKYMYHKKKLLKSKTFPLKCFLQECFKQWGIKFHL